MEDLFMRRINRTQNFMTIHSRTRKHKLNYRSILVGMGKHARLIRQFFQYEREITD